MNCPKCKSAMAEDKYEGMVLDFCTGCRGVWASNEEMAHVVMTSEKAFKPDKVIDTLKTQWQNGIFFDADELEKVQILVERQTMAANPKAAAAQKGVRKCPHCAVDLAHADYERVAIDECGACGGAWLDSGELEEVIRQRVVQFSAAAKAAAEAPKAAADMKKRREEFIKSIKFSRYGVVNRFARLVAKAVVD